MLARSQARSKALYKVIRPKGITLPLIAFGKVRWTRAGSGKSGGGVRVIYFNRLANGEIWLLFMYAKAELDSISGEVLREMKDDIEKAFD